MAQQLPPVPMNPQQLLAHVQRQSHELHRLQAHLNSGSVPLAKLVTEVEKAKKRREYVAAEQAHNAVQVPLWKAWWNARRENRETEGDDPPRVNASVMGRLELVECYQARVGKSPSSTNTKWLRTRILKPVGYKEPDRRAEGPAKVAEDLESHLLRCSLPGEGEVWRAVSRGEATLVAKDGSTSTLSAFILLARCPPFRGACQFRAGAPDDLRFRLEDVPTCDALQDVVAAIHSGKFDLEDIEDALCGLTTFTFLGIQDLAEVSADYLGENISVENAGHILACARTYRQNGLANDATKFIAKHKDDIFSSPEWREAVKMDAGLIDIQAALQAVRVNRKRKAGGI